MASTRIVVDTSKATGQLVTEYVDAVMEARNKGERLRAMLDSASSGSDWGAVEAETGAPAGQGQNLWTIISNADSALQGAALDELARLDQG